MKITINRKKLLDTVNLIKLANSKDANAEVLLNGYFDENEQESLIELVGYSPSCIIKSVFRNETFNFTEETFKIALNLKKLTSLLSLLLDDELTFNIETNKLQISNQKSKHSLYGTDSSLFPDLHNSLTFNEVLEFNTEQLKNMLKFTELSMDKIDSAQYMLKSWNLKVFPDSAQFSSFDGSQASLGKLNTSFDLVNNESLNIVFPFYSLEQVKNFIVKAKTNIEFSYSVNYCKFKSNDNELFINQMGVAFPDVTKLIFDVPFTPVEILNSEFARLIKLVKIAEESVNKKVLFKLVENKFFIELRSTVGDGSEYFEINYPADRKERRFSVNDKNLLEYLSTYPDKTSTFKIFESDKYPVNAGFKIDNQEYTFIMFLSFIN